MKRTLLTLTAIGALAIPVGVVSAIGDDSVDPTPTTTIECDQVQLRQRLREDCDGTCDQLQTRTRNQLQIEAQDGSGDQLRTRTQLQDQVDQPDQVQLQAGQQARQGR